MGTIGIMDVNTAAAQNSTAGTSDTSNMTTFEENMTDAGVGPATGGMTNMTKWKIGMTNKELGKLPSFVLLLRR